MALTYESAVDAILGRLKTRWDADTPALVSSADPVTLVYEQEEQDLKPHPRDTAVPWARAVVRHFNAAKVTLNCEAGTARYRRMGLVWVQVFVPSTMGAPGWTLAQKLAMTAQKAYEGQRELGVVFTDSIIIEKPKDGALFSFDIKTSFYWDQIR